MLHFEGHWYCQIPIQDQAFIENTAVKVAYDYGCSYIAIRAGVHNTRTNGRDPKTRKMRYVKAPFHFTMELKHRTQNRFMTAHVYTDSRYETKVNGARYVKTKGLQTSERLKEDEIDSNPEKFPDVTPMFPGMTQGLVFRSKCSAENYRPIPW